MKTETKHERYDKKRREVLSAMRFTEPRASEVEELLQVLEKEYGGSRRDAVLAAVERDVKRIKKKK